MLPHLTGHVGYNRMPALQLHPKPRIGQSLGYGAFDLDCFFLFRHETTLLEGLAFALHNYIILSFYWGTSSRVRDYGARKQRK